VLVQLQIISVAVMTSHYLASNWVP
jgi:hypothetical protein